MAFGATTINAIGGAVNDLFAKDAFEARAKGNRISAAEYDLAAGLARQNKQFAETSTEIKEFQARRNEYSVIGQQRADVAASGFTEGGSALDILRDSTSQAALNKAVIGQQGLIEEAGYDEQAKSYDLMAESARVAADADDKAAHNAPLMAAIKGAAAIATLF